MRFESVPDNRRIRNTQTQKTVYSNLHKRPPTHGEESKTVTLITITIAQCIHNNYERSTHKREMGKQMIGELRKSLKSIIGEKKEKRLE